MHIRHSSSTLLYPYVRGNDRMLKTLADTLVHARLSVRDARERSSERNDTLKNPTPNRPPVHPLGVEIITFNDFIPSPNFAPCQSPGRIAERDRARKLAARVSLFCLPRSRRFTRNKIVRGVYRRPLVSRERRSRSAPIFPSGDG